MVIYEENQALKDCLAAVSQGKMWRGELKGIKKNVVYFGLIQ